VDTPTRISLKCDPTLAGILRETYVAVTPGWHLNKKHWNSVNVDGTIPESEILEMIDHSYEQVVKGMSKKVQAMLNDVS
jgi:predicted DNA-binding protein (MmcQ/YjbR family)